MNKALVLLSGGQDSTTCLYWALENFSYVEAVGFDYGQRHSLELKFAKKTALIANVCLLYTSPSPRDRQKSRMPSSA